MQSLHWIGQHMLSLYNVLATEPSHRLSNLRRSFLCYHTSILMLLLVLSLGPFKQKKKKKNECPNQKFYHLIFPGPRAASCTMASPCRKTCYRVFFLFVCVCFYLSLVQLIFPSRIIKATTNFFFHVKNSCLTYQS